MRRHSFALALAGAGCGVAAIGIGLSLGEGVIEDARLAARYTARTSFVLFLIVFLASTLMLRERRGFGLSFAAAHFVHLGALISFFAISGEQPPIVTMIGGGLGYLGIAALVATSNDAAVRRLGRNWPRLHRTVVWYVWAIFLFSYARRALTMPEFILPTALLIAAAAAKLTLRPAIPRS